MFYDGFTFQHRLKQETGIEDEDMFDKTLQREMNLAKNIQATLLNGPSPQLEGGEIKGSSLPARLIGGDYFDFYPLLNGKLRIVIGDVMGKGIPAAMLMILTRGAFRSAAESTKGPGETLTAMNKALCSDLRLLKSFVTVFCADWDPGSGMLTYANAGHIMPLYVSGGKREIEVLPRIKGIMIGGLPGQVYKENAVRLTEKDLIFFYTDGIVEAINENKEQYQIDRLQQILLENHHQKVEEIEKNVLESIRNFTAGTPQKDDITMVMLKVNKENSDIVSFNSPAIQLKE